MENLLYNRVVMKSILPLSWASLFCAFVIFAEKTAFNAFEDRDVFYQELIVLAGIVCATIFATLAYRVYMAVLVKQKAKEHVPLPNNHSSYIVKHWYGEHSLQRSFWLNFFVAGYALGILTFPLIEAIWPVEADWPPTASMLLLMLFFLVFVVWQYVGVWRSASNYSKYSGKSWGKSAKLCLVLYLLVGFTPELWL